jgi:hypothetical protein
MLSTGQGVLGHNRYAYCLNNLPSAERESILLARCYDINQGNILTNMGYIPYIIVERKGELNMPTICHFYGIIIVMYLRNKEHNPPHIHAITQDFDAPFLIATGEIMEGEFPPKARELVKEFIMTYQKELEEMWETEQYRKLPPLN